MNKIIIHQSDDPYFSFFGVSPTRGFTIIELMLVSAIIGLLAAIAVPKMANLIIKSKEAAIKGKLGSIRSAITIYYADNEGIFPLANNYIYLIPKYLERQPEISIPQLPGHKTGDQVFPGFLEAIPQFVYAYNQANGDIRIGCTHTDSQGIIWSTY